MTKSNRNSNNYNVLKNKIQGKLWCTVCQGSGKYTYKDYKGLLNTIKCPICKGLKTYTYKGKTNENT